MSATETQAAHTPGPWEYSPAVACVFAGPEEAPQICSLPVWRPQNKENGTLIAAAPELLAALYRIDANAAESVEWIRRVARAAIAKAAPTVTECTADIARLAAK